MQVQRIPPKSNFTRRERAELSFDRHQFDKKAKRASEVTGLTYQDLKFGGVLSTSIQGCKQTPIPRWATTPELLQQVVLTYLEQRYYIRTSSGTPAARLAAVHEKLENYFIPFKFKLLRLINRYAVATGKEKARLGMEIQNTRTALELMERGVDKVVAAVVYRYYLLNQNSLDVARELGLKPPHVRQIINRLNQTWQKISGEWPESRYAPGGTFFGKTTAKWPVNKLRDLFFLRASGASYPQIGKALGISASVAGQSYRRHFLRVPTTRPSAQRVRITRTTTGVRYELT